MGSKKATQLTFTDESANDIHVTVGTTEAEDLVKGAFYKVVSHEFEDEQILLASQYQGKCVFTDLTTGDIMQYSDLETTPIRLPWGSKVTITSEAG